MRGPANTGCRARLQVEAAHAASAPEKLFPNPGPLAHTAWRRSRAPPRPRGVTPASASSSSRSHPPRGARSLSPRIRERFSALAVLLRNPARKAPLRYAIEGGPSVGLGAALAAARPPLGAGSARRARTRRDAGRPAARFLAAFARPASRSRRIPPRIPRPSLRRSPSGRASSSLRPVWAAAPMRRPGSACERAPSGTAQKGRATRRSGRGRAGSTEAAPRCGMRRGGGVGRTRGLAVAGCFAPRRAAAVRSRLRRSERPANIRFRP